MNYLIDTQFLLHNLNGDHKLPNEILDFCFDYNNIGHVSVVSLHELVIKNAKNQIIIPGSLSNVITHIKEENLGILPVNAHHIIRLETLERESMHKDPFDRLLIAQCIEDRLTFITSDSKVNLYEKYGLDYIQYELN
ncbi:MAG: type II toxin-antitoxin system VapC family toxin [Bacteroidales bacterium]|jgi:PIN domain nuclease of toxin-antitoxin system|nr:type II toxin-antitoxin system VapC family toxin [Bacteroidales bacterium]